MAVRRELLAAISGTGLALTTGCFGNTIPADGDDDDSDPDDFNREVSLLGYDDIPEEVPLTISMEVTQPVITAEETARLRKEVENTNDEPVTFSRIYYKGRPRPVGESGILIYSVDAQDTPNVGEAVHCVPGADPEAGREASDMTDEGLPAHSHVRPGHSVVVEYLVADEWDDHGCFPPGEYRFSHRRNDPRVWIGEDGEVDTREDPIEFEWGFDIEVRE